MNIFEVIGQVTHRIEPFHSEFLATALEESLQDDRRLFEGVWGAATGNDAAWPIPGHAEVKSEDVLGHERIDLTLRDVAAKRIVGIEVKTTDASAKEGQLESYRAGLSEKYPDDDIRLAYLTPFNATRARGTKRKLRTIEVFANYAKHDRTAVHLSWLDIAEIPWDGGALWEQQRAYVHDQISDLGKLSPPPIGGGKELREYLDAAVVDEFWESLAGAHIHASDDGEIQLGDDVDGRAIVRALRILIESPRLDQSRKHTDAYPASERRRFLDSPRGRLFSDIFDLAREYSHVWLQGKRDFGLRVAHPEHSAGVSILRSNGESRIVIGHSRRDSD